MKKIYENDWDPDPNYELMKLAQRFLNEELEKEWEAYKELKECMDSKFSITINLEENLKLKLLNAEEKKNLRINEFLSGVSSET